MVPLMGTDYDYTTIKYAESATPHTYTGGNTLCNTFACCDTFTYCKAGVQTYAITRSPRRPPFIRILKAGCPNPRFFGLGEKLPPELYRLMRGGSAHSNPKP